MKSIGFITLATALLMFIASMALAEDAVMKRAQGMFKPIPEKVPAINLKQQAKGPVQASVEMNNTPEMTIKALKSMSKSTTLFKKVFSDHSNPVTFDNMAKAIEAFEATLITPDSRFDRYLKGGGNALNATEKGEANKIVGFLKMKAERAGEIAPARPRPIKAALIPTMDLKLLLMRLIASKAMRRASSMPSNPLMRSTSQASNSRNIVEVAGLD